MSTNHFRGTLAVTAIASVMLLTTTGFGSPPGPAASKPDLSSPQSAAVAVVRALERGDTAALSAATVGGARHARWVEAQAVQLRGFRELEAALSRRFGSDYAESEAGQDLREMIRDKADREFYSDLKRAAVGTVKGDEAVLVTDPDAAEDGQPRLVRTGGEWKLDLESLSDYAFPEDAPALLALGRAAGELAREIRAGRIESVEAAAVAADERLSAAEDAGAAAAQTQPAPAGKK